MEKGLTFKSILETIPFGVLVIDNHSKIHFTNEEFDFNFGKISGQLYLAHIGLYKQDQTEINIEELKEKTRTWITFQFLDKNGVKRYGQLYSINHKYGLIILVKTSFKKQLEHLESDLLKELVENANEPMFIIDINGRFIEWNSATISLFKYDLLELKKINMFNLLRDEQRNELDELLMIAQSGQYISSEFEIITKQAQVLSTSFSMKGIQNNKYFAVVVTDLSDIKSMEAELTQERERSAHSLKMAALGEMAGGISHEIKNPLSIIAGYSQNLRRIIENNKIEENKEKFLETLERIEYTVERIEKVVNALKSFSREGVDDPFQKTLLSEIIQETIDFSQEKLKVHGVEIEYKIEPESITLDCRPVQVSQVILNLVNNAVDAIEYIEDKWVRVEATTDNEYVTVKVINSGPRIPDDIAEKIFNAFFTTKVRGKGTGLGLSISQQIAEDHKGSLSIDLTQEHTTFVFKLKSNLIDGKLNAA
ncbi:MAG: PAS domain S-box protein [Halobacteriovoraceae bacterium]|nr:PAS domain S-box protein [Halobacteriovoraceae bacterium]